MADEPQTPFAPSEVEERQRGRASTSVGTSEGGGRERNHRALALGLAALVFALDQFTKYVVIEVFQLQRRSVMELFEIFDLRWVENYGVSMGFLTAGTDTGRRLLVALTAAISIGVTFWLWRE